MVADSCTYEIVEKAYDHRAPFAEPDENKRVSCIIMDLYILVLQHYGCQPATKYFTVNSRSLQLL